MMRRLLFALFLLSTLAPSRDAEAARGGPDAAQYIWLDQNEPFVDNSIPTSTGSAIPITVSDETMSTVQTFPGAPPFAFPFYGGSYTQFVVSDNGWMTFDTSATQTLPSPPTMPAAAPNPGLLIAPFWRDLEPAAVPLPLFMEEVAGGIHFRYAANVKSTGDFVQIHWVLYATGVIKVWYQITAVEGTVGIGIQKDATVGLQPYYKGTSTDGFVLATDAVLMFFPKPLVDCTGATALACATPVLGAVTSLAGPNATGYLCSPKTYLAREKVFSFTNPGLASVQLALSEISPSSIKLGLFVLAKDACNEFRCIAGGGTTVDLPFLPAGRYYVVVDGETLLDTGTFKLTATCNQTGETLACQPPSAPPVSGVTAGNSTWQNYPGCAGFEVFDGPEYVYAVPFVSGNLRARLSNHSGGELDVLVFPSAELQPSGCIAWGDENLVVFDPPSDTYFVMVEGKAGYAGPFDIQITCGVNLDCSSPGTALTCQSDRLGSTTGATNKVDDYACSAAVYDGGEAAYSFNLPATATVGFRLEGPPDLEMLLIQGSCNEARCIAAGTEILERDLAAGDYHIVVDGKNQASGDFTILPVCASELQPRSLSTVLSPGQCQREDKTAWVNAEIPALDVLFVQDATAGQANFILNELPDAVDATVAELAKTTADIRVGFASFRDYVPMYPNTCGYLAGYGQAGDWAWRVEQPFTTDMVAIHARIASLVGEQGGDNPESYARAWYESWADTTLGWRKDAKKVVIMFGDDVPHDCDVGRCVGATKAVRGVDPGRGEMEGDANDLRIMEVMDEFATKGIVPVFVYAPQGPRQPTDDLTPFEIDRYWRCWMDQASGLAINAPGGIFQTGFPALIRQFVEESSRTCHDVTLQPSAGYESWMQNLTPASIADLAVPGKATFSFDICPPLSTPSGVYNFTVDLLCEGRKMASQQVQITTSNCGISSVANITGATCAGASRTFDASTSTVSNCTGPLDYQFRDPNDQIVQSWSGTASYTTPVLSTSTWAVEIRCRDQVQCPGSGRKDFLVTVTQGPTANAGPDVSACLNQAVTLGLPPAAGFSYSWAPSTYLDATNVANPTATPTSSTPTPIAYTLTVTETASGCTAMDTVLLSIAAGAPIGSIGNNLRATKAGADVHLDWSAGALNPKNYNVHRTGTKTELALPTPTAPVLAGIGNTEIWDDVGAMASPPSLHYYQVYGRDCSGNSIFQ